MTDYIAKPKYKGYTLEFDLPQDKYKGYSVECTYKYSKKKEKYGISMWLKRKDLRDKFKIESEEIDTQYIYGTKETIVDYISRIVEQMVINNHFDDYVERFEYTIKCFDIGCEVLDE